MTCVDTWLRLWTVFELSLAAVLALGWAWRRAWALIERQTSPIGIRPHGRPSVTRHALILACVLAISAALTFAP